ncbi:unnamed protein product [Rotaria sp. Silwood1]|nr:unnamed protein product [Rotaria sp. Silwood1]
MPISDELNLIRLPFESDRFHISNDKNEISLSEPITFKQLTLKSIEFEYVDDNRKTIQIIEISSHHSINKSMRLNVKSISFDKLPAKIQKLENDLIQQLTQISIQLNDSLIIKQVKNLTNHMQDTQLLNEFRPIILSAIKNRATIIEEKFETLLKNIQNKSHQLKQSERIRFEYFQFLYIRFNEEMEQIEPFNIHHEFYAMKIQQITNDLVSMFHSKTSDSSLFNTNQFSKTFDHLKTYEQILNKQKINNDNKLKHVEDEISISRGYSLFDSLVREQMDNLIKQQNEFAHHKELIIKMQTILNETINQFHSLFMFDFEHNKN